MVRHNLQTIESAIATNEKIKFEDNFNTKGLPKFIGRGYYFFSLLVLAVFFLVLMPPIMLYTKLRGNRELAYPFAHWGAVAWLRLSGAKIVVRGQEHLARNQSYVFVSNHRSYLDTAVMFAYTGKKMGVIAKKEMLDWIVAGKFMKYVNVIAIDRSNKESAIQTLNEAAEKLRSGISFAVFAEGTRAMPSELLPFKKGAFHLAIGTGFPIVPVAMKNTDFAMGKKQNYATPEICEMVMLPPLETKGLNTEEDLMNLLKETRGAIAEELRSEKGKIESGKLKISS
ncbi:MAG: lysophospholipid acyltransferase family protein [Pyrinomonadaceae bacterium]